jgi:betaine-aldehyde dehydrogenase
LIAEGQLDGARLVSGGRRPKGFDRGYFLEPTIFDRVPDSASIWREEIFGPVVCVRAFGSEEEAVALANDTCFGLAGAVMSADQARAVGSRRAWMPASSGSIARSRRSPRRRGGA